MEKQKESDALILGVEKKVPGSNVTINDIAVNSTTENNVYLVEKGDHLLKISKKLFGTIKRWQEILNLNKEALKKTNILIVGMKLLVPPQKYVIYLIKSGDTLSNISQKLYGTVKNWKKLRKLNNEKFKRNSFLKIGGKFIYKLPLITKENE